MSQGSAVLDELSALFARIPETLNKLRAAEEWVDQHHSPLGKRRHLALVRSGELPGHKIDKLVLVRRADLDAFILRHRVHVVVATDRATDQAEIDALVRGETTVPKRRRRA